MKHSKWILSIALTSIFFSSCSSESTKKTPSGPDCTSAPLATFECLEGSWVMEPTRNATASAILAEDAAYAGRSLPLSIETGDDAITITFTFDQATQRESVEAVHTLKPELYTVGYAVLADGGAGLTFKGLWDSDPLDVTNHVMTSAKIVEKPDGYYLILGKGVFSHSPSGQVAEVFYRSLTDE